jgi:hypothetical protein
MLRPVSRITLAAAIALLVAACGGSSTSPTPLNLAGTWYGSMTDLIAGQTTLQLVISESGATLSGTWTQTYPDINLNALETQLGNNSGTLSGSIDGTTVNLQLTPQRAQACYYPINFVATISAMNGTWTFDASCLTQDSGNASLTKQ